MTTRRRADPVPRAEPRLKVFRLGETLSGADRVRVHLLDISSHGARLHAQRVPRPGAALTLACATVHVAGHVRWVDAERFGIRFVAPLSPAELDLIVSD